MDTTSLPKSLQRTVFNGTFMVKDVRMGFNRGKTILYTAKDGSEIEMTAEEFGIAILNNMVFVESKKQKIPPVKVMVKVDLRELQRCNFEDIREYKT